MTTPPTTLHERIAAELDRRRTVLERHAPILAHEGPAEGQLVCAGCNGDWLADDCPEIGSLASRLGVSVDG